MITPYPLWDPPITPIAPWPPCHDHELERLRRLEQRALREQEKARIRQRLREMGIDPDAPCQPIPPRWPCGLIAPQVTVAELLRIARRSKRVCG